MTSRAPTRGVGWVLLWFAALVTLFVAVNTLAQFGYCLAGELALARAARAGVLEATLPRATHQSVWQSIQARLADYPKLPAGCLRFRLQQNGAPIRGVIQSLEGDLFCVTLSVPAREMLPSWLGSVCFWRPDSRIEARAERQMPGRQIPDL